LEAEAAIVGAELETLEATVPLGGRLEELEQQFQQLGTLEAEIESLIDFEAELAFREDRADALAAITETLGLLQTPPPLEDPDLLELAIGRIETAARVSLRLRREAERLAGLPSLPVMTDEAGLERLLVEIHDATGRIQRLNEHRESLATLASPPAMEDSIALQALVQQLDRATRDTSTSKTRCERLSKLIEPPQWLETGPLQAFTDHLQEQSRSVSEFERCAQVTSAIDPPPMIVDDAALALDLERLAVSLGRVTDMTHALVQIQSDLSEAEARLREAASSETCPTCGQSYDADRLMDLSGTLGGHAHGAA
jgi:hypothetical protein